MLLVDTTRAFRIRALSVILCSLFAVFAASHAHAADSDDVAGLCKLDSLPQDIRSSLTRNFGGWKVVEPADLTVRGRTRWGSQRPLTCPGIAAGHFQDKGSASYALLMIPANHAGSSVRLVIYTQQSGGQFYGFKAAGQQETGAGDLFISAEPISKYYDSGSKWAKSKLTEGVLLVDASVAQAFMFLWGGSLYESEQVNYQ
jgi:hypothetical protein